jgi:hypothetical protein
MSVLGQAVTRTLGNFKKSIQDCGCGVVIFYGTLLSRAIKRKKKASRR